MREEDYQQFGFAIRACAASYEAYCGPEQVQWYWSVLEQENFQDVQSLCHELMRSKHPPDAHLPNPHALKDALHQAGQPTTYEVPCQHEGCHALLPWPGPEMFCPRHQQEHGQPSSVEERKAILVNLTPAGRAFLRCAVSHLMQEIPVTQDEQDASEAKDVLSPRAERLSEPAVSPRVFLDQAFTGHHGLSDEYARRRQMVTGAGFRLDKDNPGQWVRGRRRLTDEQIDLMPESALSGLLKGDA